MSKNNFYFLGKAPFSKSLLNRALIIKSWFPDFVIHNSSQCEDIVIMEKAIKDLKQKKEFYCGLSGTAFRFLATRLSREKGEFLITTKEDLLKRPLKEIKMFLSQLSVQIEQTDKGFLISSQGWKVQGDYINVPSQVTSQYASALVLNSWDLEQDIYFSLNKKSVSYPYLQMTLDFVKNLGLVVQENQTEFFIPKVQTLKTKEYNPEQDKSCLFALASFAVLKGQAVFLDWEENSLQPDNIFPEILQKMGVQIEHKNKQLIVSKCENLKTLNINLKNYPDLFPLLSVLCAKTEGLSTLTGLSHLAFKESNRLQKIKELLELCGIQVKIEKDQCFIYGKKIWKDITPFTFDTANDHRIVMAGELVAHLGVPITVIGKNSINKSFPEFYSCINQSL